MACETLVTTGQVVLDGGGRDSVLRVACDGAVRLAGLLLVGGAAPEVGGGLAVLRGTVELLDCTFRFNKAPMYGGGGLAVLDGTVTAERCRFEGNTGRQGGGVLVDGVGVLTLRDCALIQNAAVQGGALRAREAANVTLSFCTLADNKVVGDDGAGSALFVTGSTTRQPQVTISNSVLSERSQGPSLIHEATPVNISRSLLPPWAKVPVRDNLLAEARFVMSGNEPYLLDEGSAAIGAGDAAAASAKDLHGQPRVRGGKVDLGAFAWIAPSASVGY